MTMCTVRRPIVRYHGGKWRLASWIISHFPAHRTYVEPFGGGASVLLRKARAYSEVYNDIDGDIVNLFQVLRVPDHAMALADAVRMTPFARREFESSYERTDDFIERARRTCIMAHMGFGSAASRMTADGRRMRTGLRSAAKREGTLPAHNWRDMPEVVLATAERMRAVVVESRPAATVIDTYDDVDTLFYVDPPYVHSTRSRTSINTYAGEMSDADHATLADQLRKLRGMVVLSGYRSKMYDDLYHDWPRVDKAARGDGAVERVESLWLSPRVAEASR